MAQPCLPEHVLGALGRSPTDTFCEVSLSLLWQLQQNTTDWVSHKQKKLISDNSGGWKFKIKFQHTR